MNKRSAVTIPLLLLLYVCTSKYLVNCMIHTYCQQNVHPSTLHQNTLLQDFQKVQGSANYVLVPSTPSRNRHECERRRPERFRMKNFQSPSYLQFVLGRREISISIQQRGNTSCFKSKSWGGSRSPHANFQLSSQKRAKAQPEGAQSLLQS